MKLSDIQQARAVTTEFVQSWGLIVLGAEAFNDPRFRVTVMDRARQEIGAKR